MVTGDDANACPADKRSTGLSEECWLVSVASGTELCGAFFLPLGDEWEPEHVNA